MSGCFMAFTMSMTAYGNLQPCAGDNPDEEDLEEWAYKHEGKDPDDDEAELVNFTPLKIATARDMKKAVKKLKEHKAIMDPRPPEEQAKLTPRAKQLRDLSLAKSISKFIGIGSKMGMFPDDMKNAMLASMMGGVLAGGGFDGDDDDDDESDGYDDITIHN